MEVEIRRRQISGSPTEQFPALHPVLAKIYGARGISEPIETDFSLSRMIPPDQLGNCHAAAELLHQTMKSGQQILIIGDFDADGATSTALAIRALKAMGYQNVDYLVPNRFHYGYGLTPEIVALAAQQKPDLIITVDNGIASCDGVSAAQALGMRVLVTDHHLPGQQLPEADVIVNPVLEGETFPSKHLSGVGVIFYVMIALRAVLRERGWFSSRGIEEPNLSKLLDLVALGTVADLVQLDQNNRILVEQGIRRIRSAHCNPGIQALLSIGKRSQHRVVTSDLGFVVAPRLNAAGRLDDMSIGIECLLTDDNYIARQYAAQLEELNQERKQIESEMKQDALQMMEQVSFADTPGASICLYDESWHQGVIGILAARVKERHNRPTIVFANSEQEGEIKGSARSIAGIHIREVLDKVAKHDPALMRKYGGHAMAAGVSMKQQDFSRFKTLFEAQVSQLLTEELQKRRIETDGTLYPSALEVSLAELLREAAPWGQGFPEPMFDGEFEVLEFRLVGGRHHKLKLRLKDSDEQQATSVEAIAFNQEDAPEPRVGEQLKAVYRLDVNEFRGNRKLQLVLEHLQLK